MSDAAMMMAPWTVTDVVQPDSRSRRWIRVDDPRDGMVSVAMVNMTRTFTKLIVIIKIIYINVWFENHVRSPD